MSAVNGPLRALAPLRWIVLGAGVGVLCGLSSALFLWLLERATHVRTTHETLVYALPVAGLCIGWLYERFGRPIRGGNNLVIDTFHGSQGDAGRGAPQIPLRMAPMVLLGTVLTHLFGGSAGREGTAVQMGASLADALATRLRASGPLRRQLLAAGVAGGFGSVFGTPIAGAVFGLEVVVLGHIEYEALIPALVASVIGDLVTRGLGIVHTAYPVPAALPLSPLLLAKWVLLAAAVALMSVVFIESLHALKRRLERHVPRLPVRMFLGGAALVGMWKLAGTSEFLGLGVPGILRAFTDPGLPVTFSIVKLVFTIVTLGTGFLGGEVTPLFFIGAALGNVLARALGLPIELGAALGLAALFGAAANAPLALSIMAVELLGAAVLPHVVLVCAFAYLLSGHRSIYPSQRLLRDKLDGSLLPGARALREIEAPAPTKPDAKEP